MTSPSSKVCSSVESEDERPAGAVAPTQSRPETSTGAPGSASRIALLCWVILVAEACFQRKPREKSLILSLGQVALDQPTARAIRPKRTGQRA
jgi:hypothetical protein